MWDEPTMRIVERIKVDSKGRISIPKGLREHLGLNQGTELEVFEDRGRIVLVPLMEDPVEAIFEILRCALPKGKTATEIQYELRAEWDRDIEKEAGAARARWTQISKGLRR